MANFSTSFGYDLYIVPLASAEVDLSFTGVTTPSSFISTTTPVAPGAVISYASGVFSVGAVAMSMDGTDDPFRLYGLTNASLETDTNTEDIVTYDDETEGFNVSLPTSKTWSLSLSGVADFKDAGYHVLRLTERNTIADALRVKVLRVGPTGTDEAVFGYGTINGYTESIEAGSIASWEATIQGYGPYLIAPDFNV
ncbi:MAG: phage tail tube protein [Polynucleobacter sp.]